MTTLMRAAAAAFGIFASVWAPSCLAAYPDHPIRLIVGFDAGTSADLGARQVTVRLSQVLHQNVVVENHGGAGGIVATNIVAHSQPDGYTLLFASAQHAADSSLYRQLPYDPEKDFTPVGRIDIQFFALVVSAALPVKSVADLIAYARARPGQLNYASLGNGTTGHLAGALFANIAGLQLVHVPYKGASQAIVDLIGDQVEMMFYTYLALKPMIDNGKLRVLATTGTRREPYLPDIPTMRQAGVPGFLISTWHGIYGPAKLPRDITDRLNAAIAQTLKDPTVLKNMAAAGVEPSPTSPEGFAAFTRAEIENYQKIVPISGANVQ